MTTYRFGYGTQRLTLEQLETRRTWIDLHPEIRRRLIRMFDVARAGGHDLGIGEGARDPVQQEAEFYRRHNQVSSGGCCSYKGKRWALKPGMAPIAPPGNSNHEKGILDGFAMAADLVGWEDHWFDANCQRFGLKNFGGAIGPNVNNEEWHAQPVEFANSRKAVDAQVAAGLTLTAIPLPGDTPPQPGDDDMPLTAYIVQPPDERYGKPWLVVCDGDIRPATSYDISDKKMPIRQLVDEYRVEQYDQLRAFVGI